ncbi:SDR family oxidoreductase [Parasphingopyxis algicola]|uniref:SDR family NAD(P)-dependent oxidoreductase n=1 Tax=Parasphingopyxis algicola TaxID=2026624 RepID=UPI00159FA532|nr:SDR family oxidoreductase [Parasphingopyxis algicola]QLC26436.1 SDR family oxidoreductase [Parasphingopyxis algicola]
MSSIARQELDLTSQHAVYEAIDPQGALKAAAAGKVLFITGASRGIGRATAAAFAAAGAKAIYATARSDQGLNETREAVEEANPNTEFAYLSIDVTDPMQVSDAVNECVEKFGGIDVADANAGALGPWKKLAISDPESWWTTFEVNVRGAYHVARHCLPYLIESAARSSGEGSRGGHLLLVSSVGAQLLVDGASDYQTSKHAINRLCEFVQSDHGAEGVKCFAMHPGGVATEIGKSMPDYMHEYLTDPPELAAAFAVWLSSGQADWAAGRYLSANWDVEELLSMKDVILKDDLLVNRLRARL